MKSANQASVHIVSGGDYVRIIGNVLGFFDDQATWDCYKIEPSANPNFHIAGNDCAGANDPLPTVYYSPFPSASVGYLPVIRHNRGATGFVFALASGAPNVTNLGPYDCTYYVTWNSATVTSLTITYAGGSVRNLPTNPLAATIFVPVGATLASTVSSGTPSATGFCLP